MITKIERNRRIDRAFCATKVQDHFHIEIQRRKTKFVEEFNKKYFIFDEDKFCYQKKFSAENNYHQFPVPEEKWESEFGEDDINDVYFDGFGKTQQSMNLSVQFDHIGTNSLKVLLPLMVEIEKEGYHCLIENDNKLSIYVPNKSEWKINKDWKTGNRKLMINFNSGMTTYSKLRLPVDA